MKTRALVIATALVPALVNTALAVHFFTATARRAVPYYSDEVAYYNEVAAFQAAGFGGGYITVNEREAPAAWSRFGPHGPTFAVVYGSIAKVTGWHLSSPVDINLLLVTAGALTWLVVTKAPLAIAAPLFATFWPLAFAVTTAMQEPVQYALVFAIAALMAHGVAGSRMPPGAGAAFAAVMALASLLRPSWALALVPWLADRMRGSRRREWLARAVGLTAAVVAYLLYFLLLGAPYPGGPGARLADVVVAPLSLAGSILDRAAQNAVRFVSWRDSAALEIVFRYETVVLLAALTVSAWKRRHRERDAGQRLLAIAAWFTALTLAGVIAMGDVESWRDYRVLTPVVFLALLLAANARWRPVWAAIAVHAMLLPLAASTFVELYEPKFRADRTRIERFRADVAPALSFESGASGWSNTVLVPIDRYEYPLLGLPAGFGLSTFYGWDQLELPLKSRYLLLHPADREAAPEGVHLRELRRTVHGTLYENLDWRMLESRQ